MAIRLSGLQSGFDTEALVSALVSSYSLTKNNMVKAQTRLSWKQDKWKTMNSSIYSFYSGSLSAARYSKAYNLKTSTVSNSLYAKVTASSGAVNGTQSLEVDKIAATGYLTGGTVKKAVSDEKEISGDTKLSEITGLTSGGLSVTAEGKTNFIELTADMTVDKFVSSLRSAGVDASFDTTNQRFYVSSKTSGKSHDFALTAGDANGLSSLKSLGLFTTDDTSVAEYEKWSKYTDDEIQKIKDDTYKSKEIIYKDRAAAYVSKYNSAKSAIDALDKKYESESGLDAELATKTTFLEENFAQYKKEVTDEDGNVKEVYDRAAMKADGVLAGYDKLSKDVQAMEKAKVRYNTNSQTMADTKDYVIIGDDGKAVSAMTDESSAEYATLKAKVDTENAAIKASVDKTVDDKVVFSKNFDATAAESAGAVRITGLDSEIHVNGALYTSNTNDYSINGLTIQAVAETKGEKVSVTTNTDIDGIYKSIKSFLKDYNTLIKSMDEAYNATSAKGYEPLLDEEKEALSDSEVEKWEKKIQDSLLRKDSTLGNASSSMKNLMQQVITIDGKNYSLSNFGIGTLGYFESADNEKGVLHIDGDSEDTATAGDDDKLRAMIASDPDTVMSFFSKLATSLYTDLGNRMSASSLSSVYTIYNDKEMATEYSEYTTKIADQEDKISTWEDYYYKKFTAMESALAALNSQSSSLSGLFS